ncbi:hypothetical protein TorRG33x02_012110 [Trema orientale]|uniref:Uncharacterized protein n=1 Tax=Trema orientale TaxID=63057 RepID=A0A2P5FZC1_TREOI|nr:hypothetical protein TorRG33x02_012110 [Trema orientale]
MRSSEIELRLQYFGSVSGASALSRALRSVSLISSTSALLASSPDTPQHDRHTRRHRSIGRNDSTATGSFHRAAGEGPPNTDDERELEGEFGQKDIRNNDDHDSTSYTGARLVDEVFNRLSKRSETTSAERRSKKNRSQQIIDALLD